VFGILLLHLTLLLGGREPHARVYRAAQLACVVAASSRLDWERSRGR
jgi:hypothetical protein